MSGKRKRVVLSLGDKGKILKRLKNNEAASKLAAEFGVGKSTISDIKKNEESIMKYLTGLESEQGSLDRKSMKKSFDDKVGKALHMWFLQKRSSGHPISGPLLCEKALFFNEKLNGENTNTFQASSGWLRNFKLRHGIREIGLHGEKLSVSTESATKFVKEFIEFVKSEKYEEEFIYNADETGLFWRSLPRKTLASGFEKSASGTKLNKERIIVLNCANATGNHRIPLFVIGHSKKPRCFNNWKNLPVIYTSQRKAWMTSEGFIDWYDHTFIPKVKTHQEDMKKEGRVLLLLDNAPSHPCADTLERENGKFRKANVEKDASIRRH
ncbi:jerky protein homolog-like [Uloborus diversus]|uniref:jerky protein homolog-like n=1 Tax=Uloborus diversus TaxID=327109 RepID=UPI00240A176D|nr:jerky protein homolog-like [Uloborus diversus]